MHRRNERTALYRLYSASNALLYVGVSVNPGMRIPCHASEPWWAGIDRSRTQVEWHPNRRTAERAERAAIEQSEPLFNVVYQSPVSLLRRAVALLRIAEDAVERQSAAALGHGVSRTHIDRVCRGEVRA